MAIALLLVLSVGFAGCTDSTPEANAEEAVRSDYALYRQEPYARPSYFPLKTPPHPYQDYYYPVGQSVGAWTGRLILPQRSERQSQEFVWFEVQHAPDAYQDWVGSWVRLQWQDDSPVQSDIDVVTVDVQFTEETWDSLQLGRIHPTRLQGMEDVGALESLAGARPADDVVVLLRDVVVQADEQAGNAGDRVLAIAQEPVQITGRWQGLVKILEPVTPSSHRVHSDSGDGLVQDTAVCNRVQYENSPVERGAPHTTGLHFSAPHCRDDDFKDDDFWVQHFNKDTQQFDGPVEQVRIPQVPPTTRGVYPSVTQGIEASPLNDGGWYVYGDRTHDGTFVVQAIEPRQLMRLSPTQIYQTEQDGIDYIRQENWANTPQRKGTGSTVLIAPTASTEEDAIAAWSGARALVLHLFGGIGGEKAEPQRLWTTTGHFSFGIAEVIHDPLTNQPRFWIEYHQVYAHNSSGIVSGTIHWSDYMGNLNRGWLGNRPVSDVLVQLDVVTQPYVFGDIVIDPLAELTRQLSIMAARYRTGNGTGAAIVTPATSCVQDSNQALYATIQAVEQKIATNPTIQAWLAENPSHPQTQRFNTLVTLGQTLESQLTPLGIVRDDWQQNTGALSGVTVPPGWSVDQSILSIIQSWRTMLPRRAHDELSAVLLSNGGMLWVIRTNQIGGNDPTILPRAPTTVLGF
jgi:predicted Abi (CAAX) family protease